jgi:hypothetical protein
MQVDCNLDWHLFAGHWYVLGKTKSKDVKEIIGDVTPLSIDYYVDDRGLQRGRPLEIDIVWTLKDFETGKIFYSCARGRVLYTTCQSLLRIRSTSCPHPAARALNKFPWGFRTPYIKEMQHVVYSTDYITYALVGMVGQPWAWILGRETSLPLKASYEIENALESAEI